MPSKFSSYAPFTPSACVSLNTLTGQLCRNGHARVDALLTWFLRCRQLKRSACCRCCASAPYTAESSPKRVNAQSPSSLNSTLYVPCQQIAEVIAARLRPSYGFGNAVRMPVLRFQQRNANARKRLRAAVDDAVAICRRCVPLPLTSSARWQIVIVTKVDCVALLDADLGDDRAVLRLLAEISSPDGRFSRTSYSPGQDARKVDTRPDHRPSATTIGSSSPVTEHLDIHPAKADPPSRPASSS